MLLTLDVSPALSFKLPENFFVFTMSHGDRGSRDLRVCLSLWTHMVDLAVFILLVIVIVVIWLGAAGGGYILELILELLNRSGLAVVSHAVLVELLKELCVDLLE